MAKKIVAILVFLSDLLLPQHPFVTSCSKGSSIYDVTVLKYYYDSTKALVIKRVTMGGGWGQNSSKLRDVIYGRPLKVITYHKLCNNSF